jgi:excisionase family DNA binding protein
MNQVDNTLSQGSRDAQDRETQTIARTDYELQELLTVDDVARLLNVEKSWVYEHTRSRGTQRADRLPRIKLGKYVRFEPRAIEAYLAKRAKNA